jgi:hypothetical protein
MLEKLALLPQAISDSSVVAEGDDEPEPVKPKYVRPAGVRSC